MPKTRSLKHPEMDLVTLRPWVDDKDIPSIEEHKLADDFGK